MVMHEPAGAEHGLPWRPTWSKQWLNYGMRRSMATPCLFGLRRDKSSGALSQSQGAFTSNLARGDSQRIRDALLSETHENASIQRSGRLLVGKPVLRTIQLNSVKWGAGCLNSLNSLSFLS